MAEHLSKYPDHRFKYPDHPMPELQLSQTEPTRPAYLDPLRDLSAGANLRDPIRTADLNAQHFKYSSKPVWGFGSAGIGYRYKYDSDLSKSTQKHARLSMPHAQHRGRARHFRDRRDMEVKEMSEKEWLMDLEKTLAQETDAAQAQAQAAAAASASSPIQSTPAAATPKVVPAKAVEDVVEAN